MHGGSLVDSDFELGTLRHRNRDLTTRPPRSFLTQGGIFIQAKHKCGTISLESLPGKAGCHPYIGGVKPSFARASSQTFLTGHTGEVLQGTTPSGRFLIRVNTHCWRLPGGSSRDGILGVMKRTFHPGQAVAYRAAHCEGRVRATFPLFLNKFSEGKSFRDVTSLGGCWVTLLRLEIFAYGTILTSMALQLNLDNQVQESKRFLVYEQKTRLDKGVNMV
ncbi:hypothetical protein AVEN_49339-1 [Araneus ventricosus]|uniref:Uncharacterized protein n=1 Tax=Araneus ventricosus TaxID=182803 RepID=A0A4Y2HA98_ARAVE|nr:hypothetical protein AVEN_49339-1 [Araneus ventricosus]